MFSVLRRSTEHSQMDKKEADTPIIASIKVTSKSPNKSQIQQHARQEENDLAPKCGGVLCAPISKCINRLKIQLAHPALTLSSNRQKREQQHFTASNICITAPHRKRSERISATAYATTLAITYDTKTACKDRTQKALAPQQNGPKSHEWAASGCETRTRPFLHTKKNQ